MTHRRQVTHPGWGAAAILPGVSTPAVAQLRNTGQVVRVLYVAGTGRSGSTLFGRLLGQAPGCTSVGEVARLWQRGLRRGLPCSCGRPFDDCPHWARVGREAFGGWEPLRGRAVVDLQRSVDRVRYVAAAAVPLLGRRARRRRDRYTTLLARVYAAVAAAGGADVVVDTSKRLSTLLLLRRMPSVDLRVVHLVRDSRGVAYSWTKPRRKPEVGGRGARMDRFPPAATALRYLIDNVAVLLAAASGVPTCRVHYEDFVDEPRRLLDEVLAFAGVATRDLPFVSDGSVRLEVAHSLGGNPGRFVQGTVPLRRDDEWLVRLPAVQRALVTALTAPLLVAFGYPLRRAGVGTR